MTDKMVHHPPHYNAYSVEVIEVTRYCSFDIGNAIKYMLRHPHKGSSLQDLDKALWYLRDFVNNPKAHKGQEVVPSRAVENLYTLTDDYIKHPDAFPQVHSALRALAHSRPHKAIECLSKALRSVS